MPYVRLTRVKHIRVGGVQHTYHAGDWVDVGRQTATLWLKDGSAMIPGPDPTKMEVVQLLLGPGCGVRLLARSTDEGLKQSFGNCLKSLRFSTGPPALPYPYTMIWNPAASITSQQVLIGFSQITSRGAGQLSWEMVARLAGKHLARDVGSNAERSKTKALIGDLRIPVYDTKILWVRKTEKTEKFLRLWALSVRAGEDETHAFLRALYSVGVLLCTLPAA